MIYQSESKKKMDSAFLEELHQYLTEHPQDILRNIKKAFSKIDRLDEKLDKWIEKGYIKREKKRYETQLLTFQPASLEEVERISSKIAADFCDVSIFEIFKSIPTEKIQMPVVLLEKDYERIKELLWHQETLSSEKFEVEVFENEGPQTTLSRYFSGSKETSQLKEIYELLGDVVCDYYLDNTLGKLYRSKGKALKESRKDIFTTSLELFGLLDTEKKAQVVFLEDITISTEKVEALKTFFLKETKEMTDFEKNLVQGKFLQKLGMTTTTAIQKKKRERKG